MELNFTMICMGCFRVYISSIWGKYLKTKSFNTLELSHLIISITIADKGI